MRTKSTLIGAAALALVASSVTGLAATDKQQALANGAKQLDADEIARRFAGKTVTFASGKKRVLVYYGKGNDAAAKLVGGKWSDTGFYGVADNDSICLSWEHSDKPRLRCLEVLVVDGVVQKFKPDGSLAGSIVKFEEGKAF